MHTSKASSTRLKLLQGQLLSMNFTSSAEKQDQKPFVIEESTNTIKVTLNRPKQLNSFSISMMDEFLTIIRRAEQAQKSFLLLGNEKAFCAGGDLKELLQEASDKDRFLKCNLKISGLLFCYAKLNVTSVAVCDGYAFGVGCGLLTLSKIRIITEAAVLCMPQARNGSFSGDGISYVCSKLPKYIGKFLTLTGENLKGAEIYQAGLADHFVLRKNLPALLKELEACLQVGSLADQLKEVIVKYQEKNLPKRLKNEDEIKKYFSDKYLKDIIGRLEREAPQDAKAEYWLKKVKEGCPWMLLHNNFLMENTSEKTFDTCINLELSFLPRMRPEDAKIGLSRLFSKSKDPPKWRMSFEDIQTFNEDELVSDKLPLTRSVDN